MQDPYRSEIEFYRVVGKKNRFVGKGRYEYLESKSRKKIFRPKKNFLTEKIFSIEIFFKIF